MTIIWAERSHMLHATVVDNSNRQTETEILVTVMATVEGNDFIYWI